MTAAMTIIQITADQEINIGEIKPFFHFEKLQNRSARII
jgi:hypothetical protein